MLGHLLIATFLVAHAAIHVGFVSPRPPATAGGPAWPFSLDRSWLLTPAGLDLMLARRIGTALLAITLGAFAISAIATLGLLPAGAWVASIAVGSIASLALMTLFFHPWLSLGIVIDVVLLWAALVNSWTPDLL
jgi:hypothetical protein